MKKLYIDIKSQHPDYDQALADIKDTDEKSRIEIDNLNKTFIKDSYFITDPGNIKKTIGYNDSSVRIGLNKIQDWNGSPESKYKNLKGNIGVGMNVNGSLVADEKISEISVIKNIAIGNGTFGFNLLGNYNTGVGHNVGIYLESGIANTGVGYTALMDNKKGSYNTAIGSGSGTFNTGNYNTFLGRWSGRPGDGKTTINYDWTTCVGSGTVASNSNQVILGTEKEHVYSYLPLQINSSDDSFQINSVDSNLGLDFIIKLKPKQFEVISSNEKSARIHIGLNAKDVKKSMDEMGIDYGFYQDHSLTGGLDRKTVSYQALVMPLINAIKELDKKNKELEQKNNDLEKSFNDRLKLLEDKIISAPEAPVSAPVSAPTYAPMASAPDPASVSQNSGY